MSYILLKAKRGSEILPARILSEPEVARAILQPTRWKILCELAAQPRSAKEIARKFGESEQTICYHMRELDRLGLIRLAETVKRRGAIAKYYVADPPSFAMISEPALDKAELTKTEALSMDRCRKALDPFIGAGKMLARIIIGSPDAHGEFKARARDGHYAVDLALFLGSLLPITRKLVVKMDTEAEDADLADNLIIVGGPRVNTVTARINDNLPIRFDLSTHSAMVSKISGRTYHGEEEGAIQIVENPLSTEAKLLVLAGNTHVGTRAAIIGFVKYAEKVAEGNSYNSNVLSKVVSGVDLDSDGLVDDVEFIE